MEATHHYAPDTSPYAKDTSDGHGLTHEEDIEGTPTIRECKWADLGNDIKTVCSVMAYDHEKARYFVSIDTFERNTHECKDKSFGLSCPEFDIALTMDRATNCWIITEHDIIDKRNWKGQKEADAKAITWYGSEQYHAGFSVLGIMEGGDVPICAPYSLVKNKVQFLND